MPRPYRFVWGLCLCLSLSCFAEEQRIVEHDDPLVFDNTLNLGQVIDIALKNYPYRGVVAALHQESASLKRRSNGLLADAPSLAATYIDDAPFDNSGLDEFESEVEFPLWRWGQRAAGQDFAEKADRNAERYGYALRYEVAGKVREVLWAVALEEQRQNFARARLKISQRLTRAVQRRVELGDLAEADLLLARSDQMEKRVLAVAAEAAYMQARHRYYSVTRIERAPAQFAEALSAKLEIDETHPKLALTRSKIERLRARLKWVQASGREQPKIALGFKRERGARDEPHIESLNVGLSIPFGEGVYVAPEVAAAQVALSEAMAEHDTAVRELERGLHEARHALEVDRAMLEITRQRRALAENYLKIGQKQFDVGEISLLDLLKINANTDLAIRDAEERALVLQRDTARYNQVVGELP